MVIYHTVLRTSSPCVPNSDLHLPIARLLVDGHCHVTSNGRLDASVPQVAWRYCLEMTGAMVAPIILLVILVQVGILPSKSSRAVPWVPRS